MNKFKKLQLDLLDKEFIQFKEINIPKKGWINSIRNSLSMTLEQLAKRLNVSVPAIVQFERSEVEDNITLKTLRKVAKALNCKLSYVLIPNDKSLHKILERQAYKKAKEIIENVDNSMALEKQQVNNKEKSIKILAKELLAKDNPKIWSND